MCDLERHLLVSLIIHPKEIKDSVGCIISACINVSRTFLIWNNSYRSIDDTKRVQWHRNSLPLRYTLPSCVPQCFLTHNLPRFDCSPVSQRRSVQVSTAWSSRYCVVPRPSQSRGSRVRAEGSFIVVQYGTGGGPPCCLCCIPTSSDRICIV